MSDKAEETPENPESPPTPPEPAPTPPEPEQTPPEPDQTTPTPPETEQTTPPPEDSNHVTETEPTTTTSTTTASGEENVPPPTPAAPVADEPRQPRSAASSNSEVAIESNEFDSAKEANQLADAIEKHAKELSESLTHVMGSLRSSLHAMGGYSADYMRVYSMSVGTFGETVQSSVTSMNGFIDKCKTLNDDLLEMRSLQGEIKGVLASVDTLDAMAAKLIKEKKTKRR